MVGLIDHLAVSIIWGILFAWASFGLSRASTVGVGLIWGLFCWSVMYFIVLPLVGAWALTRGAPLLGPVIRHAIFGLALGDRISPLSSANAHSCCAGGDRIGFDGGAGSLVRAAGGKNARRGWPGTAGS